MANSTALVALGTTAIQQVPCYPFPTWLDVRTIHGLPLYGLITQYFCRPGYEFEDGLTVKNNTCNSDGRWNDFDICTESVDPEADAAYWAPVDAPDAHYYGYGAISIFGIFILFLFILDMDLWYYGLKPIIKPIRRAIRRCRRRYCLKYCQPSEDSDDCSDEDDIPADPIARFKMQFKKDPRKFSHAKPPVERQASTLKISSTSVKEETMAESSPKLSFHVIPNIVTESVDVHHSLKTNSADNVVPSENDKSAINWLVPENENEHRPRSKRRRTISVDEKLLSPTNGSSEDIPPFQNSPRRGSIMLLGVLAGSLKRKISASSSSETSIDGTVKTMSENNVTTTNGLSDEIKTTHASHRRGSTMSISVVPNPSIHKTSVSSQNESNEKIPLSRKTSNTSMESSSSSGYGTTERRQLSESNRRDSFIYHGSPYQRKTSETPFRGEDVMAQALENIKKTASTKNLGVSDQSQSLVASRTSIVSKRDIDYTEW